MRIIDVLNSPWAILPEKYNEIRNIYITHLRGEKIDIKAIEHALGKPLDNDQLMGASIRGNVATVYIHGVLAKKMNMFQKISGGMSMEMIVKSLSLVSEEDNGVDTIILDIDSPGGTVEGTALLANYVYSLREKFHIVAVANETMGSAAYWIGSAAHEIYAATVTSQIGSIGTMIEHEDVTERDKAEGKKVTVISSGENKAIGNPHQALTKSDREAIQQRVSYGASVFIDAIAHNLGVDASVVETMADGGRVYMGEQAVEAGLVAGVQTLDQLTAKFLKNDIGDNSADNLNDNSFEEIMDKTELRDKYPELYAQIVAEGAGSIDVEAAIQSANAAEKVRIQAVLNTPMAAHHQKIIQALAFDGVTTPAEAALKILEAETSKTKAAAEALQKDSEDIGDVDAGMGDDDTADASGLPLDQSAKAEWDKAKDVRDEFHNNFDVYLAYLTAIDDGRVRQLRDQQVEA